MPATIRARHRKRSSRSDSARMKEGRRSWGGRAGRGRNPCFWTTSPLQSPREPTRSPSIPSIEQGFCSFTCRGVYLTCYELRSEIRRVQWPASLFLFCLVSPFVCVGGGASFSLFHPLPGDVFNLARMWPYLGTQVVVRPLVLTAAVKCFR
ncbi:hypothetical protein LZ32DRAFT_459536 [Colletotrichum eremochloae]|nr:hypothetical protein LZ32DRAFT_459536 [Colletotrichum eremochloae]